MKSTTITAAYLELAEKSAGENWAEAERMRNTMKAQDGLLNGEQAATLLDISRSRVSELLKLGMLTRYDFMGNIYLSCKEVLERRAQDIKAGRPKRKTFKAIATGLKVMAQTNKDQMKLGGLGGTYPYSLPEEKPNKKGRKQK